MVGEIPTGTDSEKVVTGNDDDIGNTPIQIRCNNHDRRVQEGSNSSSIQHGSKAQNISDYFLLPGGPVQGIVRVFRRLRSKDNVCVLARAVFETPCKGFRVGCFVIKQDCPRDVG